LEITEEVTRAKKGLGHLASSINITESAHRQGLITDKEYARQTGFQGFLYNEDFKDHGRGVKLQEKRWTTFERTLGKHDAETMDARGQSHFELTVNWKNGAANPC